MKVLNIFDSMTGNTAKVAKQITAAAEDMGANVDEIKAGKELVEILSYDFVFIGSGVYGWLPGKSMQNFLGEHAKHYMKEFGGTGDLKPGAPRLPGKVAAVYCTFGGSHTGINEAIPAVKYMGQLFDHLGFEVAAEWYVPGAYGTEKLLHHNTEGRLGDIRNRPNEADLTDMFEKTKGLITHFGREAKESH